MANWHKANSAGAFTAFPPKRGKGMWSIMVWVALSDGQVVRAQCLYAVEGGLHSWYLDAGDDGRPGGELRDVKVVAWALIETPEHPISATGLIVRRLRRQL